MHSINLIFSYSFFPIPLAANHQKPTNSNFCVLHYISFFSIHEFPIIQTYLLFNLLRVRNRSIFLALCYYELRKTPRIWWHARFPLHKNQSFFWVGEALVSILYLWKNLHILQCNHFTQKQTSSLKNFWKNWWYYDFKFMKYCKWDII
jgi:hypothetical protein